MDLCETNRDADGRISYHADGKRITREAMREIKRTSQLDTFLTERSNGLTRQHCCARRNAA